jgi:hypothetical protein
LINLFSVPVPVFQNPSCIIPVAVVQKKKQVQELYRLTKKNLYPVPVYMKKTACIHRYRGPISIENPEKKVR